MTVSPPPPGRPSRATPGLCKGGGGYKRYHTSERVPATILGPSVPRDALPPVHNIVARTEQCVQRTLPVRTVFFWDIIVHWTRGGGGICVRAFLVGKLQVNIQRPMNHVHRAATPPSSVGASCVTCPNVRSLQVCAYRGPAGPDPYMRSPPPRSSPKAISPKRQRLSLINRVKAQQTLL